MYSILYFDTEDSISPPEYEADDIVQFMAMSMTQRNITGSFHIIGDKARTLVQRNRMDVISALKHHDTSSHYNHGSVHPNTTEQLISTKWHEGVQLALALEKPGFETIENIFGRCAGLTRHGGSFTPQAVHAAGQCGKVFYGVPFDIPGHRAFWFAGTLCFSILGLVIDPVNDQNGQGYFENVYHDDQAFTRKLNTFAPILKDAADKYAFTSLFGAHPHRLNATEFSCWNYYNGVNRPIPLPTPLRSPEARATGKKNFLRFMDFLAAQRSIVNIRGLSDLAITFGHTPSSISSDQLHTYAQQVRQSRIVPLHAHFSPAELVTGLAEAIVQWFVTQKLPDTVGVTRVIGPVEVSQGDGSHAAVSSSELQQIARGLVRFVTQHGHLPHDPPIASTLGLLAGAYDDIASGKAADQWSAGPREPWPGVVADWLPRVKKMAQWGVFARDIDFSQVATLTALQSWSVKPAWPV